MKKELLKNKIGKLNIIALLLCVLGASGSYAMFTSINPSNLNLTFELGTMSIEIAQDDIYEVPINIAGILPGEVRHDSFEFKNAGTLKQKLDVDFDIIAEDVEMLKYFTYEFTVTNTSKELVSKVYSGNIFDLKENGVLNILNEGDQSIILEGEDLARFDFNIRLAEDIPTEYSEKGFSFDLNIVGTQLNDINIGK